MDTVNLKNIIFDSAMINWCETNIPNQIYILRPKRLPSKLQTVGKLDPDKINKIEQTYLNNNEQILPKIDVKRYNPTSKFFIVTNGRHRIVMALKYGKTTIEYNINVPITAPT